VSGICFSSVHPKIGSALGFVKKFSHFFQHHLPFSGQHFHLKYWFKMVISETRDFLGRIFQDFTLSDDHFAKNFLDNAYGPA
jgi:hypothetical protein